jgi:pullulanase/glycogen debranching enzyme
MIIFSEALPNPSGKDTEGEFIELYNNGNTPAPLAGWSVKDASEKTYTFGNDTVPAHGFFVLKYSTSKISLNNTGDTIVLYDAHGIEQSRLSWDEKLSDDVAVIATHGGTAVTSQPTPGAENIIVAVTQKEEKTYYEIEASNEEQHTTNSAQTYQVIKEREVIEPGTTSLEVVVIALGVAILLTIVFWKIFKKIQTVGEG